MNKYRFSGWLAAALLGVALNVSAIGPRPADVVADDEPNAIRVMPDQSTMIGGFAGPFALFTQRYGINGEKLGRATIPAAFNEEAILRFGRKGELFVAAANNGRLWVMKFAVGSPKPDWLAPFTFALPPGSGTVVPSALEIDGAGDVFVAATASGRATSHFLTLKLAGLTGTLLWGPVTFGHDLQFPAWIVANAMALDSRGNVVVAGSSTVGPGTRAVTLMYNGVTGDRMWGPVILDSGGNSDVPAAVAAGESSVTLVAQSEVKGVPVFATVRYDRMTGARLWGPVLLRGAGQAVPTALALDAREDVYVTGQSNRESQSPMFATVKYNGATGNVEWGPAMFSLGAKPVAIACYQKDVTVLGHAFGTSGTTDLVTFRLNGYNGKIVWLNMLDDPGQDYGVAMALDQLGNPIITGMSVHGALCHASTAKYDLYGKQLWKR
jgi:hypothetical protein